VFGELARRYPQQVRRIFIRDVGRSTAARYASAFAELDRTVWQVFSDPAKLPQVLDIEGGELTA
jgi:phosphatidate phosphatase APP1